MSVFHGYRLKSSNIRRVERVLSEARSNLAQAAKEEYHRMLSDEIAEVTDDIALNVYARPDIPIFDAAVQRLAREISMAETRGLGTEYDLRSGVSIVPDTDYTYFLFTATNPALEAAFAATNGIEDYTVGLKDREDDPVQTKRGKKWERLYSRRHGEPILLTAGLTSVIEPDIGMIRYIEKTDRAKTRARRTLTTRYMNDYAGREQIPPEELMRTLDKAFERVVSERGQEEMDALVDRLMKVLPDITKELITFNPSTPIRTTQENEETAEEAEKTTEENKEVDEEPGDENIIIEDAVVNKLDNNDGETDILEEAVADEEPETGEEMTEEEETAGGRDDSDSVFYDGTVFFDDEHENIDVNDKVTVEEINDSNNGNDNKAGAINSIISPDDENTVHGNIKKARKKKKEASK